MSWQDDLRQASFRGVPFGVHDGTAQFGRRTVEHQYPFRDIPYLEDLGRAGRKINLTGFLLENDLVYDGGDVIDQLEQMIAAAETKGLGELIHPVLGSLQVSLPEGGLSVEFRAEDGGYVKLGFGFIESGQRLFPTNVTSTSDNTLNAAIDADAAASEDFGTQADGDLLTGAAATVGSAVAVATSYGQQALSLVNDATRVVNVVSTLTGNFGRYAGGRNQGPFSQIAGAIGAATQIASSVSQLANGNLGGISSGTYIGAVPDITGLLAADAASRAAVSDAAVSMNSVALGL